MDTPGSWDNSRAARIIYDPLLHQTREGFQLVADKALPRLGRDVSTKIHIALMQNLLPRLLSPAQNVERLWLSDAMTLASQAAECGMRALQGGFLRL